MDTDFECRTSADLKCTNTAQQGEHDGQLYLARQVEVQPVFNREFIAELSDGESERAQEYGRTELTFPSLQSPLPICSH